MNEAPRNGPQSCSPQWLPCKNGFGFSILQHFPVLNPHKDAKNLWFFIGLKLETNSQLPDPPIKYKTSQKWIKIN
jgi:hypothetical protein